MELEEILAAPFTTATTCFSCSPCADTNRNVPFRFVTENHVLGLAVAEGIYRTITYGSVPRDKASVICVGMAQYPVPDSEPLQALTFIDPLCIDQPEDAPLPLQHPTASVRGIPDTSFRDDASIVSNTHSISIQDGSRTTRPQSRRPSFNTGPTTASTTSGTASSASNYSSMPRTGSDSSMIRISDISASIRTNTTHDPSVFLQSGTSVLPPKARLILQGPSALVQDSIAILDFRPLAPCIAKWGQENNDVACGVFVGSADDSLLRFYEPKENRLVLRSDLPKEHFQIDTPVMAMDFYSNGTMNLLALAGQDGTIRMITWRSSGGEQTFADISSHTVIVDGPLVCLQIHEQQDKNQLQIVIGSLCGYVCRLKCTLTSTSTSSTSSLEWQGPTMVVHGLWNDLIKDEDSVLAVHAFEDCIAIGTLAGRVLIYQASWYGDNYYKLWECMLPYSIHGLQVQLSATPKTFDMIVVTRRSVHVFRPTTTVAIRHDKPKYSVAAAKVKLQSLLQTPPSRSEPNDESESELQLSPTRSTSKDQEDTEEKMIPESVEDGSQKAVEPYELVEGNVGSASPSLQADQTAPVEREGSANWTDVNEVVVLSPPTGETSEDEIVPQHDESELQQGTTTPQMDLGDNDDSQWVIINDGNGGDGSLEESTPKV